MYQQGTGLPRSYAMLLAPDARLRVNDRPARWRDTRGAREDDEATAAAASLPAARARAEGRCGGARTGIGAGGCWARASTASSRTPRPSRRRRRRCRGATRDGCFIPNRRPRAPNPRDAGGGRRPEGRPGVDDDVAAQEDVLLGRARGRARKLGATGKKKRRRVVAPDGETLHLVPEDIVVVREVRTEDEASMPASVANAPGAWVREGWRLSAATSSGSTGAAPGDASSRRFAATGERFDGCWFQDFDYQVPVFERALSGVPENASESGRREVLRLDALALEVMLEDARAEEEEGGGTKNTKGERAAKMMKREKPVKPPRKICRPPKRVSSPTPSRSIEKYPRCEGCGETEWHFSSAAPGEPDLGAPVVIRCDDASCASRFGGGSSRSRACWWHPQCARACEDGIEAPRPRRRRVATPRRRRRRAGRARMAQPQTFRRVWGGDARRVRGGNRGGGASYL